MLLFYSDRFLFNSDAHLYPTSLFQHSSDRARWHAHDTPLIYLFSPDWLLFDREISTLGTSACSSHSFPPPSIYILAHFWARTHWHTHRRILSFTPNPPPGPQLSHHSVLVPSLRHHLSFLYKSICTYRLRCSAYCCFIYISWLNIVQLAAFGVSL